jgi:mRNA-degrading endonuclease RelE of RelBE toxin-antitoxin system
VRVEWSAAAQASVRRYMRDQAGIHAIATAVSSLAEDPYPVEGFHRGDWHRLQVGAYRVLYAVEGDLVTVVRVDRVSGS